MRVLYDRKREELKMLDEKGAEAHKLEATELYIRKLSTKISIAIQVVNTISEKISKLRDEELWPQTCELIQGYVLSQSSSNLLILATLLQYFLYLCSDFLACLVLHFSN